MNLTDAQLKAVTTGAGDVLVIAGAGSGKTRVLVERIVHLVQARGVSPSSIMCLTFTRRAAGEMRARLLRRLLEVAGDGVAPSIVERDLSRMMMGTFHSVAFRILRQHGEHIGYTSPTVVEADDADALLMDVCATLGFVRGRAWRNGLSARQVERARESYYTTSKAPEGHCGLILGEYRSRLFQMQLLDFGSILLEVKRLFERHPWVLQKYHEQIKHVLVDESQDSDEVQYNLHDLFAPPACFFAVGDRRQSIYGFRGARPDLMRQRHPDAELIDLRECFRSGPALVESANRLIAHNGDALAQPMISATEWTTSVEAFPGRSTDVVRAIIEIRSNGYAWHDIAVLARRHATLGRIEQAIIEHNAHSQEYVPFHRVGASFDVCSTDPFRLLLAAMRLTANPADNLAFIRLLPETGLTPEQYAAIWKVCAASDKSLWASMIAWCEGDPPAGILSAIHDVLCKTDDSPGDSVPVVARQLAAAFSHASRFDAAVAFWDTSYDRWGLQSCSVVDALRYLSLRDAQDDLPRGDVVTLATIHAAKGLEWPCVILTNCMEGELPSSQAQRESDGVKEERRVMYVAMTRAREALRLHWRRPCDQFVDRKPQAVSRFIGEAGVDLRAQEFSPL